MRRYNRIVTHRLNLRALIFVGASLAAINYWHQKVPDTAVAFLVIAVIALQLYVFFPPSPRRPQRGLCPLCGYDLRATPERCPECGTVVNSGKISD
jgi:hypothetical protein